MHLSSLAIALPFPPLPHTTSTIDPEAFTPEEMDHLGRSDLRRWASVVKATGFSAK